jgi:hypothetical protein
VATAPAQIGLSQPEMPACGQSCVVLPALVRLGTDQVWAEQAESGGKFRYATARGSLRHAAEEVAENILEAMVTA